MRDVQSAIESLKARFDKSLATILVTERPDDRYFIEEALLVGATLFVLNRYAGAYLDGLGLKSLAEAHGKATCDFLRKLRSKGVQSDDYEEQRLLFQQAVDLIREKGGTEEADQSARLSLTIELIQSGALEFQAADAVVQVSTAVRSAVSSHGS